MSKEPERLNPVFYPSAVASEVNQYLFLPLADFDPYTSELRPVLIKNIPEETDILEGTYKGGISYTFEIKEEAKWDDGKPITMQDYIYTLKAILHPSSPASNLRSYIRTIADVKMDSINPRKAIVFFDKYYILSKETTLGIDVLPRHIYDPNGVMEKFSFDQLKEEKKAEALVKNDTSLQKYAEELEGIKYSKEVVSGAGPYKLTSWNSGQNITLERKENYWAKSSDIINLIQGPKKISMYFIPDEAAAFTRFRSGQIDVLSGIKESEFDNLRRDSSDYFSFNSVQLPRYYSVLINHSDVILSAVNVRKALAHLINVEQFIKTFENGNALRCVGPVLPIKPYYNTKIAPYPFDIDQAKLLLKNDGWSDTNNNGILDKKIGGKMIELSIPLMVSGKLGNDIALIIQSDAKKAGINIELIKKEFAQIRKENLETGKYSMVLQVNTQSPGLYDFTQNFHSKNADIGESNQALYKNIEVDKVIDAIAIERDPKKRNELYLKAQELIHEDLPHIFLYSPKEFILFSSIWDAKVNTKRPGYQANTFKYKN
jgi:peptide/nickel transport system substrate-binding protein